MIQQVIGLSYFTVYLVVGLTGVLFMVVMELFGDLFEGDHDFGGDVDSADHDHGRFLSLRVILLFLTGFGVFGMIGTLNEVRQSLTALIATGGGVAMGFVGGLILNFFQKSQASSTVQITSLVGMTVFVSTTIPVMGVGEVTAVLNGTQNYFPATGQGGMPVEKGPVTVLAISGSTLIVVPIT
jgi:hypothetical protein